MITEVPYDPKGNLMHFPRQWGIEVDWRPNEPFEAELTLDSTTRGRSAAYFTFVDLGGHKYPVFMTDISEIMATSVIDHGKVSGRWVVGKRGQNYGLRLAQAGAS